MKEYRLSLNQLLIPKTPLLKSKESFDELVNISIRSNLFAFDRFAHRYYSDNLKEMLNNLKLSIESKKLDENAINIELQHKTSVSGLPYQLHLICYDDNEQKNIYFDGFIFLITIDKISDSTESINEIIKLTDSALGFRNDNWHFIEKVFGLEVRSLTSPFWCAEVKQLNSLIGLDSSKADYPVFRMICNDKNFFTETNYGDKQSGSAGRKYYTYFAEYISRAREKVCHDMIIEHELDSFKNFLNDKTSSLISANTNLIKSLKAVPSSIFSFFKRHSLWLSLKGISSEILEISTMLPKYKSIFQIILERVTKGTSYINAPQVFILVDDNKYCRQREVESFFELLHDETQDKGFTIENYSSTPPPYSYFDESLKKELESLDSNLKNTLETLNKTISMYSTNFGFDAIWVAIITLVVTLISVIASMLF